MYISVQIIKCANKIMEKNCQLILEKNKWFIKYYT